MQDPGVRQAEPLIGSVQNSNRVVPSPLVTSEKIQAQQAAARVAAETSRELGQTATQMRAAVSAAVRAVNENKSHEEQQQAALSAAKEVAAQSSADANTETTLPNRAPPPNGDAEDQLVPFSLRADQLPQQRAVQSPAQVQQAKMQPRAAQQTAAQQALMQPRAAQQTAAQQALMQPRAAQQTAAQQAQMQPRAAQQAQAVAQMQLRTAQQTPAAPSSAAQMQPRVAQQAQTAGTQQLSLSSLQTQQQLAQHQPIVHEQEVTDVGLTAEGGSVICQPLHDKVKGYPTRETMTAIGLIVILCGLTGLVTWTQAIAIFLIAQLLVTTYYDDNRKKWPWSLALGIVILTLAIMAFV